MCHPQESCSFCCNCFTSCCLCVNQQDSLNLSVDAPAFASASLVSHHCLFCLPCGSEPWILLFFSCHFAPCAPKQHCDKNTHILQAFIPISQCCCSLYYVLYKCTLMLFKKNLHCFSYTTF